MQKYLLLFCLCLTYRANGQKPVPLGIPDTWDGDQYHQAACEIVQQPPSWVDGFLFAQTSASYGDQSNPEGKKIEHLFDAISGVSVFDMSPAKPTFTGAYYPTRAYKIWDFSGRDFDVSNVAWETMYTHVNATAMEMWEPIHTDFPATPPNVDFWKIGTSIVAGTEMYQLGMTFDIPKVNNFRYYPFNETDKSIGKTLIPIHMPMHEHVDIKTGLIWSTLIVLNVTNPKAVPTFHQLVFTVDPKGVRKTQGIFDFSPVDYSKCTPDGNYTGAMSGNGILLPRYMHTLTGTENYLILPMTSDLLRVCQILKHPPFIPANETIFKPQSYLEWHPEAPVEFLLFDKRSSQFTQIESKDAAFFTHQFNSYETGTDGQIYVDILGYPIALYDGMTVDGLLHADPKVSSVEAHRYTIDMKAKSVSSTSMFPAAKAGRTEFSQINHKFEGKKYKYGYAVQFAFMQPSQIVKIDVDTPSGANNKIFKPEGSVSLGEPYFVQRPGGTDEDDGAIVVRGLDISNNRTRVYVLDAKTMTKVGEILSPTYTPFGLHERFYLRTDLGMGPDGSSTPSPSTPASVPSSTHTSGSSGIRFSVFKVFAVVVVIFAIWGHTH